MIMRRIVFGAACALALVTADSTARAGGFDSSRIGGERGHAASPTPFAVYYNPAALSGTRKVHLAADFTLALHSASYERSESTVPEPADAKGANVGTAKLFDVLAGPSLAGSLRMGDFAVGLGFFAPMSGSMSWDGNTKFNGNSQYPGAQDGVARWHQIEGDQMTLYSSLAASYVLPSLRLSFGAGGNLVYATTRLIRAKTAPNLDSLGNEGRIDLDVDGIVGSFSAGVMWEALAEQLWIGASYQAPPGLYDGMVLKGKVRTYLTGDETKKVELHQSLPDIVRLAVRYKADRYELRAFGDYTRWSVMEDQCLATAGGSCALDEHGASAVGPGEIIANQVRRWKDSFGARLGASYWLSPEWETFVGLGYDSNAIPSPYLEAGTLDGHDLSAAVGGRLLLGSHTALALSYTHVQTLTRTVTNSRLDNLHGESKMPSAEGEYKQWLGMFNSVIEVYFD
jgi:long-chain fatty acid transport protein